MRQPKNLDFKKIVQKEFGEETVRPWLEDAGKATQFKPGYKPAGRLREPGDLDDMLALALGKNGARALANALISLALSGDFRAIQLIYDRLKGKPKTIGQEQEKKEEPLVILLEGLMTKELNGRPEPIAIPDITITQAQLREGASGETGTEV